MAVNIVSFLGIIMLALTWKVVAISVFVWTSNSCRSLDVLLIW